MKNNLIELPVAELKTALTGLGKIIGRKITLPVLSAVRVARDKTGLVTLQGTDLDSTATFTLKDRSEGPATQVLVPLERLQKAVKQSNGRVELVTTDKDEVIVRTFWRDTPMEEKISVPYHDDWPKQTKVEGEPVKLGENFRVTFQEAMECASTDESRAVINSVYLDVEDKKGHYVVATNGRHLFSANSFAFDFKQSVIIPTRKFLGWSGWWMEGDATLAIKTPVKPTDETWLQFTADQWTFLTRGCEQPYPKWREAVLAAEPKTTVIIPEQAIAAVLQVLARLPGGDDFNKGVTLNAASSTLVLSGRTGDQTQPTSVPIVEAQIKGLPGGVTVNREYMMRALRFGLTEIDIVDELSHVVFKCQGKKMIVMPLHPGTAGSARTTTAPQNPSPTNGAAASPSAPPAEQPTENERKDMSQNTMTAPERGNLKGQANGTDESALASLGNKLETLKSTLREAQGALGEALSLVRAAEKENKHKEKEIESVRTTVRSLQRVQI